MSDQLLNRRYKLIKELGQGSIGIVYLAQDMTLKRDIAIKLLSSSRLDEYGRARFMREAEAVAQLNHPNIVEIFDISEADGKPFIVMEYIEGKSLFQYHSKSVINSIQIVLEILAALEHAHTHGVIHRDLKPENVIIRNDRHVKLTDFSLAQLSSASRITIDGAIVGTAFYMAPEQIKGKQVDQRADIYSLGIMLYELVTGRLPFVNEEAMAVMAMHLHQPPPRPREFNKDIPTKLEQIILWMLQKQPSDRPASAAETRIALETLLSEIINSTPIQTLGELPVTQNAKGTIEQEKTLEYNDDLKVLLKNISILVVDDEENIRRDIEKNLNLVGYSVETADGCIEAARKIGERNFHIALVDLTMPDFTGASSRTAGVDLLKYITKEYPGLSVIILTATGTVDLAVECMKLGAVDFLQKNSRSSELGIKVHQALPKSITSTLFDSVHINWNLKFLPAEQDILARAEDLEIFQRLFYKAQAVKVSLIAKGSNQARIYKVTAQDDEETWQIPLVVKIGKRIQIQKEVENYRLYVQDKLPRYPQIRQPAYTANRGGIVMPFLNLMAERLVTLDEYFHNTNLEQICIVIHKLFEENLGNWYRSTRKLEPIYIFQAYTEYLHVNQWDLDKTLNRYLKETAQTGEVDLFEIGKKVKNPVPQFQSLVQKNWSHSEDTSSISLTHGDLNAKNILVDHQQNCWIIDFTRIGRTHLLRDFAQLEASIKYSVLGGLPVPVRLQLEEILFGSGRFEQMGASQVEDNNISKAHQAILAIRQSARLAMGGKNITPEYLIALLFHNMDMLRYFEESVSADSKRCILYASHLIVNYLAELGLHW